MLALSTGTSSRRNSVGSQTTSGRLRPTTPPRFLSARECWMRESGRSANVICAGCRTSPKKRRRPRVTIEPELAPAYEVAASEMQESWIVLDPNESPSGFDEQIDERMEGHAALR